METKTGKEKQTGSNWLADGYQSTLLFWVIVTKQGNLDIKLMPDNNEWCR